MAIRRKISETEGAAAIAQVSGALPTVPAAQSNSAEAFTAYHAEHEATFKGLPRGVRATAVRFLLEELATLAPGNSVEVRVPPLGVTQCIAGPRHTRGTPPNVVETDGLTWVLVGLGYFTWTAAATSIAASGSRSDLTEHMPIL
ncbi:sterol carrier family protein [Rothia sp. LK2588]|uniref:sterol carrier family protein n=1 Tax=Rothia sp. LK2588 TaxID=3114369 RepID=UPI0034CF3343